MLSKVLSYGLAGIEGFLYKAVQSAVIRCVNGKGRYFLSALG